MKRFLVLLALCASAFAAEAAAAPARALIVEPRRISGTERGAFQDAMADWTQACEALGIYYDTAPPEALPTYQALTGKWYWGLGGQYRQYELVIHPTTWCGYSTGYIGCNSDSLTLYATWDGSGGKPTNAQRVMQIMGGFPHVPSAGGTPYNPTGACTTGVQNLTNSFDYATGSTTTIYRPGGSRSWSTGGNADRPLAANLFDTGFPGILRNVIAANRNATASDGAGLERSYACDDCDSLVNVGNRDSSIVWARYRDANDTAPVVWAHYQQASYSNGAHSIIGMLAPLAMADSLLKHRLIGQKPGWEPIKLALFLNGAFQRSNPGAGSVQTGQARGWSPSDSTRGKAMVRDTLPQKLGIKITLGYNPDSVGAYAHEKAWYAGIPNLKFLPIPYTGAWGGVHGNASKYLLDDVYGFARARAIGFYGQSCTNPNDTTMTCGIKWAFARTDSIWPGRTCYAIYPPRGQLLPTQFGKKLSGFPSFDGFHAALYSAGVRVIVTEPDFADATPNSFGFNNASGGGMGYSIAATAGLPFPDTRRVTVWADSLHTGAPVGSILYAGAQLNNAEYQSSNRQPMHVYGEDFLNGALFGVRLRSDYRFYYHAFRTRSLVLRVDVAGLQGLAETGWPRRYAWWNQIKQAVYPTQEANALAGREIFRWVYVDEL